jgi:Flp pilus assembly protein TadG
MRWNRFIPGQRGAASAEFAMVVFPFLGVVLSAVGLCFMYWANTTLKYAAADAARCGAIRLTVCGDGTTGDATKITDYAQSHYNGPHISPVFTATQTSECGSNSWTVSATASYPLNTGLVDLTVPLSAHACFP